MTASPFEIEVNGTVHRVTVDRDPSGEQRLRVSWGEVVHHVDARRIDSGTLSLVSVGERAASFEARVVDFGGRGELGVSIDGVFVRATIAKRRTFRGGDAGDESGGAHEVVAPMPGRVVRLLAHEGDDVAARQGVVVVEAMKMENELTAPHAGTVKRVVVSEGMAVDAGAVLLVIE